MTPSTLLLCSSLSELSATIFQTNCAFYAPAFVAAAFRGGHFFLLLPCSAGLLSQLLVALALVAAVFCSPVRPVAQALLLALSVVEGPVRLTSKHDFFPRLKLSAPSVLLCYLCGEIFSLPPRSPIPHIPHLPPTCKPFPNSLYWMCCKSIAPCTRAPQKFLGLLRRRGHVFYGNPA